LKYSRTQLHAWSEPDDYVRARRSTLPRQAGRPPWFVVGLMWLCIVVGLFVAATPRSATQTIVMLLGSLAVAIAVAFLAAWADFNARQSVILDRRRLYISGTNHPLDTIRSVVVGNCTIDSRDYPVLLVRMRDGNQHLIGRDEGVPAEVIMATFRELGIKVDD
jgi:hypothetical protein